MVQSNRKGANLLNEVLERRMLLYVLAAGAALAGTPASQAKVVFTASNAIVDAPHDTLNIDLDNDGQTDVVLTASYVYTDGLSYQSIMATAHNGNAVITSAKRPFPFALALTKGTPIGSSDASKFFRQGALERGPFQVQNMGYFLNMRNRYLGVRFLINGQTHFGWIGFRHVKGGKGLYAEALLGGWAYETIPDKAIKAGDEGTQDTDSLEYRKPTSLQLLAMGHTAVGDRQRRIAGTV